MPVFNAASWMPKTLARLQDAIAIAKWPDVQVIVVDDGSTDDTAEAARSTGLAGLKVLRQPNGGRFAARLAGLRAATGEYVLFLDARVFAHPGSLQFLREQLLAHPDRRVWNGHAITADGANAYARFWDAVTFLAWRRYLRDPRTTSYGIDDFDWYPKGTTYFLVPRSWLLDACEKFDSSYGDLSLASDDTLLIRPLAERARINISPSFSCTYHPRTSLRQFASHTFHRGTVFVDGYYRPGSRFHRPLQAAVLAAPVAAVVAIRRPRLVAGAVVAASASLGTAARAMGAPTRDATSLGALAPMFSLFYGAGVLRGLAMRYRR
jgi:glycosyltransferase involved in cell wall biosynthesis